MSIGLTREEYEAEQQEWLERVDKWRNRWQEEQLLREEDWDQQEARIRELEAERDRLREAIENAPHDSGCYIALWPEEPEECNCWKSAALNTERDDEPGA